jgi:hypothetical protein
VATVLPLLCGDGRCRALEGCGPATSDLRRILPAALGGRVESYPLPAGQTRPAAILRY